MPNFLQRLSIQSRKRSSPDSESTDPDPENKKALETGSAKDHQSSVPQPHRVPLCNPFKRIIQNQGTQEEKEEEKEIHDPSSPYSKDPESSPLLSTPQPIPPWKPCRPMMPYTHSRPNQHMTRRLPHDLTRYSHVSMTGNFPIHTLPPCHPPEEGRGFKIRDLDKAISGPSTDPSHPPDTSSFPLEALTSWSYGGKKRDPMLQQGLERLLSKPRSRLSHEEARQLAWMKREEEEGLCGWRSVWSGILGLWTHSPNSRCIWYRNDRLVIWATKDQAVMSRSTVRLRQTLDEAGIPYERPYRQMASVARGKEESVEGGTDEENDDDDDDEEEEEEDEIFFSKVKVAERKERSEDDEHQSALVIHGSNQVLALLRLLLDWQKPSALTRSLFASPYIVTNFPFPQARFSLPKIKARSVKGVWREGGGGGGGGKGHVDSEKGKDIQEGWCVDISDGDGVSREGLVALMQWGISQVSLAGMMGRGGIKFDLRGDPSWKWLNVPENGDNSEEHGRIGEEEVPPMPPGTHLEKVEWMGNGKEDGGWLTWSSHRPL